MTNPNPYPYPKLHNAMWPGLVGKGAPGAEPPIDLDTMLDLTAAAEVDGVRFDGVDLFLFDPHTSIDATDDELKAFEAVNLKKIGQVLERYPLQDLAILALGPLKKLRAPQSNGKK